MRRERLGSARVPSTECRASRLSALEHRGPEGTALRRMAGSAVSVPLRPNPDVSPSKFSS